MVISPYIFVYGTLKRGFTLPMASKMHQHADYICEAQVPGEMHLVKWHFDYPAGLYLDDASTFIHGEIFKIKESSVAPLLVALDEYEGPEYDRLLLDIKGNDGNNYQCWFYSFNEVPTLFPLIESGKFKK